MSEQTVTLVDAIDWIRSAAQRVENAAKAVKDAEGLDFMDTLIGRVEELATHMWDIAGYTLPGTPAHEAWHRADAPTHRDLYMIPVLLLALEGPRTTAFRGVTPWSWCADAAEDIAGRMLEWAEWAEQEMEQSGEVEAVSTRTGRDGVPDTMSIIMEHLHEALAELDVLIALEKEEGASNG